MAPKGSCADCGLEPKTLKKKDMWLETTWAQAETVIREEKSALQTAYVSGCNCPSECPNPVLLDFN